MISRLRSRAWRPSSRPEFIFAGFAAFMICDGLVARVRHFADRLMRTNMNKSSPGPTPEKKPLILLIGRDRQNHWVVAEPHGLCGGLFIDEASAMRFALEQSNGRPGAVRKAFTLEMIFRK